MGGSSTIKIIYGSRYVCRYIEVSAFRGSDERRTSIDLTPLFDTVMGLVSHDDLSGNPWVKIDFSTGDISSTQQSSVDPNAPNTGWFVFYNNSGTTEFRDASATSVGPAKIEMAFTLPNSSGYLAPAMGYNTVTRTGTNTYHFFWADNTSIGYGYFGLFRRYKSDKSYGFQSIYRKP